MDDTNNLAPRGPSTTGSIEPIAVRAPFLTMDLMPREPHLLDYFIILRKHQWLIVFFLLTIVSDKKKEIHIFRDGDTVRAEARIGNCNAYLEKIVVALNKKFSLLTLPEYADMIGRDVTTGQKCQERVTPGDR